MRIKATLVAVMLLAACAPETAPASESAEPTPEEMGQDDPSAPFEPAAVGPPKTYEAYSKTAMSFTPGVLTLTPTPQASENLPEGAVFQFGNGYVLKTTTMPGGATQGEKPFDFAPYFPNAQPLDPEAVAMYSVEGETVPAGAPNGGFCDKTSFLATHTVVGAGAEDITIVALSGDQWPPKDDSVVCGTFSYSRVH